MRLLQNIIKLYSSSIFKRTLWIDPSRFSTPLQNHSRKDTSRTHTPSVFARHQAKQSRRKSLQYAFVCCMFLLVMVGSFSVFPSAHAQYDEKIGGLNNEPKQAQFIPLVGIPYIKNPEKITSMADYISALYKISISIAAFLAVLKIIFAGVKYMLSDVVTTKADAKKDIRGALIGLLIVIGAVLILNTINPQLRNLNVLKGPGVQVGLGNHNNTPDTQIGDRLNMCEANVQEAKNFLKTCPGAINITVDASTDCSIKTCDSSTIVLPELNCEGNTCTCDSLEFGASLCVTQCKLKPGYIDRKINNKTNTVICTYIQQSNTCTKQIGCCFSSALSYCEYKKAPDICKVDNTTSRGTTCYYTEE